MNVKYHKLVYVYENSYHTFVLFSKINMLLNFKDDKQECPCPEYIRDQLLDFHEDLMRHCGLSHTLLTNKTFSY